MDHKHFDEITQALSDGITRRTAGRFLAGGVLAGVAGWMGLSEEGEAKRRRKKKDRKPHGCGGALPVPCSPTPEDPYDICFPPSAICCGPALGGGACEAGQACCPPSLEYPSGSCAAVDEHCCPAEAGGGSCPLTLPTCCPPTDDAPAGWCMPRDAPCPRNRVARGTHQLTTPRQSEAAPRSGRRRVAAHGQAVPNRS